MKRFMRRLIAFGEIAQGLVPFLFAGSAIEAFGVFRHVFPDEPLVLRILQSGFYAGICLLTSVAGVLLWRSRPLGLRLSVLAQIAQIPVVTTTAFSYAVKLNFGIWLFCNFDTGLVGFTASLIDNSEFALIFGGHQVAPVVEVNVLAACILLWLLRAIRRERPDYVEPRRKPLPRRALRFASRALLVLLTVVLVPLLGLWIYNRFDEAPTQSAQHWFAPMQRSVPDNENAWLYMFGIGAAAGSDDPIAFGRQRLDAYEARIAKPGFSPPSAEEHALEADPLPFQQNDARGNKVEFCDSDERDCLAWARTTAAQLTELESANAVLLQRFVALLAMTRFDELTTPSADDPLPNASKEAALYRALVLRDLANPATRDQGLQRMSRVVTFWQRAEEPAQSEFMKAFAEHERERYMRILDALVDQSGEKGLDSLNGTIDVVLRAPTPAQREWEPALHREALKFATVMDKTVFAGPVDSMRYCKSDCFKGWLMAQFYVPQATRNLYARLWDCVLDVHNGDPRSTTAAQAHITEIFDSAMPLTKSAAETLHRMSYNASGKVLTLISLPAFADYLNRQHDTEALRRMLLVKIAALRQHVPVSDMPSFLAQQPSSLRNPYTGEPLGWDATRRQIVFAPKSKKWKASEFAVAYTRAADANRLASQGRHLAQPEKR
jgi:hypothetical protein